MLTSILGVRINRFGPAEPSYSALKPAKRVLGKGKDLRDLEPLRREPFDARPPDIPSGLVGRGAGNARPTAASKKSEIGFLQTQLVFQRLESFDDVSSSASLPEIPAQFVMPTMASKSHNEEFFVIFAKTIFKSCFDLTTPRSAWHTRLC